MQRRPGLRGLGLRALLAWWLLVSRMQHTGHRGLLPVPQLRNNSRAYPARLAGSEARRHVFFRDIAPIRCSTAFLAAATKARV
jgi:hypothetical protein